MDVVKALFPRLVPVVVDRLAAEGQVIAAQRLNELAALSEQVRGEHAHTTLPAAAAQPIGLRLLATLNRGRTNWHAPSRTASNPFALTTS